MTATLTFDLNDQDDRESHLRCVKALDMALVLWSIDSRLRNAADDIISRKDKHNHALVKEGVDLALAHIRDLMNDHNINLDELIS